MTANIQELIEEVKEISLKAGEIILEIYNDAEGITIEKKDDNSPLTIADKSANDYIVERLKAISPDIPIISEENKLLEYKDRKDYQYFWLVDPLDGTKEFIRRNGEFTVNIALIHLGVPCMGVVYAPVLNELYWASEGGGAFSLVDQQVCSLKASEISLDDIGLKVVCSRSHLNQPTQDFIEDLNQAEQVATGSSLKFILIAQGKADIYPRLGPTMEWDTGAAHIILNEAGGKILRADNQEPLSYNKESLLNPYFIAYANVKS